MWIIGKYDTILEKIKKFISPKNMIFLLIIFFAAITFFTVVVCFTVFMQILSYITMFIVERKYHKKEEKTNEDTWYKRCIYVLFICNVLIYISYEVYMTFALWTSASWHEWLPIYYNSIFLFIYLSLYQFFRFYIYSEIKRYLYLYIVLKLILMWVMCLVFSSYYIFLLLELWVSIRKFWNHILPKKINSSGRFQENIIHKFQKKIIDFLKKIKICIWKICYFLVPWCGLFVGRWFIYRWISFFLFLAFLFIFLVILAGEMSAFYGYIVLFIISTIANYFLNKK